MKRVALLMVICLLAACGGGGSSPPAGGTTQGPGTTSPTTSQATTQPSGPSSGRQVIGWFEVDGQRVDATDVFRCPAISFSGSDDDFRVGVFGVLGSEELILEIQETQEGTRLVFSFMVNITTRQYMSGAALVSGNWVSRDDGTTPLVGMTYSNDGTRLRGGPMTIVQEWPEGETGEVVVSFDVPLPSELFDRC